MRHRLFPATLVLLASVAVAHDAGPSEGHRSGRIECRFGSADEFGCRGFDLLAHVSLATLDGGPAANDLWGWTDPLSGREYVLVGTHAGTVFVDISDPEAPVRAGWLPGHDELRCAQAARKSTARDDEGGGGCAREGSAWRDIKVYADHAFVVSEAPGHGMQVFNLRQLRAAEPSQQFSATAWFGGFGDAHNLAINEDTGYAYVVGSSRYGGGPLFIDISDPGHPREVGGFADDGYTHDAQCVTYAGPDNGYTGAEICLLSNVDTITVVDVSDKGSPVLLARAGYERAGYTHQGWLDDTHRWFYVNDEDDEHRLGGRTATYVWDLAKLSAPVLRTTFFGTTGAVDHNHYVQGRYLYQSHYTAGLRVLDISHADAPLEIAWFDTFPSDDHASLNGNWSNYPFFASGVIALSDIEHGLFLLRAHDASTAGDLQLELVDTAVADDEFSYTTAVRNGAAQPLVDVVVTHVLDADAASFSSDAGASCLRRGLVVDCSFGTLEAGARRELRFTQQAPGADALRVEVQATALVRDTDTRNNKASATIERGAAMPAPAPVPVPAPPSAPLSGSGGGGAVLWVLAAALLAWRRRR